MRSEEFAAGQPSEDLPDEHKKILDFAKKTYRHPGKQQEDMMTEFGYYGTTFFRKLNQIIDNPKALEYDAPTVNRYRRIREDRQAKRSNPEASATLSAVNRAMGD